MSGDSWKALAAFSFVGVAVQALGMGGVARLRGDATAYAYQSPDAQEYVSLARGIAWHGRYVPVDAAGRKISGPDTWRTPGYPAALAVVVRLLGDRPLTLLLFQQVLAAAAVPVFWLLIRRWCAPRWAIVAALLWAVDPFRVYYSLWLMAETLFTLLMLVGLVLWTRSARRGWSATGAAVIGVVGGLLVLVRPIGVVLPPLAAAGVGWAGLRRGGRAAAGLVLACLAGAAAVVGPWMLRNRIVAGHWAISHQSGASLAYHKAVDVILWSEGRSRYRFDPGVQAEIRGRLDRQLQARWEQRFGPLAPAQREALTWRKLNFGHAEGIDPFVASSLLWSVGWEELSHRKAAMVACFVSQGAGMVGFPLGLMVAPPAGAGSAPMSMLLGGNRSLPSRVLPIVLGAGYGGLALVACGRLLAPMIRRRRPASSFAFWPMAGMFALSLPFEDPRFRLPLVPLMWLLAVARPQERRQ